MTVPGRVGFATSAPSALLALCLGVCLWSAAPARAQMVTSAASPRPYRALFGGAASEDPGQPVPDPECGGLRRLRRRHLRARHGLESGRCWPADRGRHVPGVSGEPRLSASLRHRHGDGLGRNGQSVRVRLGRLRQHVLFGQRRRRGAASTRARTTCCTSRWASAPSSRRSRFHPRPLPSRVCRGSFPCPTVCRSTRPTTSPSPPTARASATARSANCSGE